jgi:hypothetical protein
VQTAHPTAANVRAVGKCGECHSRETPAIVHEYSMSRHAAVLARPGENLFSRLLYGAPVFAPLLFANLSLLAGIGVWGIMLSWPHGHHSPNRPETRERREEHHSRRSSRDIS